jgi:hypothetical protein
MRSKPKIWNGLPEMSAFELRELISCSIIGANACIVLEQVRVILALTLSTLMPAYSRESYKADRVRFVLVLAFNICSSYSFSISRSFSSSFSDKFSLLYEESSD